MEIDIQHDQINDGAYERFNTKGIEYRNVFLLCVTNTAFRFFTLLNVLSNIVCTDNSLFELMMFFFFLVSSKIHANKKPC
jgi:hypothetical protein